MRETVFHYHPFYPSIPPHLIAHLPVSSTHDDSHLTPLSSPAQPFRKVIRVETPVKRDGLPLDVQIFEREPSPPSLRELVIRHETPTQPQLSILLPQDNHPAVIDAYILKGAYQLMEEEKKPNFKSKNNSRMSQ